MPELLEDQRAVELYAEFRKRWKDTPSLDIAPYPKPFSGGSFNLLALAFHTVAQDALRELANSLNDFRRYIQFLHAWEPVYQGASDDERLGLLLEHIRPLAVLCMGAPQALRGRFIYAATAGSFHANRFLKWTDGMPKWSGTHTDMSTAKRLNEKWASWPPLASALNALGQGAFATATGNFRNKNEHGHPQSIEIGIISVVERVARPDKVIPSLPGQPPKTESADVWSMDQQAPLALADLLPQFIDQHALAMKAFKAYVALVEEQHAKTPAT